MSLPYPEVEIGDVPDELPADVVVVDVREDGEWQAGHVERAVHIPLMQVPHRTAELPEDAQLLVVCRVGARSAEATAFLQAQGRTAVNLAGGMLAWQRDGRPMVSESGAPPQVV